MAEEIKTSADTQHKLTIYMTAHEITDPGEAIAKLLQPVFNKALVDQAVAVCERRARECAAEGKYGGPTI